MNKLASFRSEVNPPFPKEIVKKKTMNHFFWMCLEILLSVCVCVCVYVYVCVLSSLSLKRQRHTLQCTCAAKKNGKG